MNQKKRKRTPKVTFNNKPGMKGSGTISVVSEYGNTGDMASTGLTSDDGNNATSPRIGGSYRDDEEELKKLDEINKFIMSIEKKYEIA